MLPIDKYINVLQQLAAHYETAIAKANTGMSNKDYYNFLEANKLAGGMCEALFSFTKVPHVTHIKTELFKDNTAPYIFYYWFTAPFEVRGQIKKKERCLQPRLNNINRTIARLQNQINQTPQ